MSDDLRWGIVGTGTIASAFAGAIQQAPRSTIVAVASRQQATADTFATAHEIPRAYGSYDELAAVDDVDIVYIATPHHRHHEDAIAYLEAGKHVLCEKPLALNAVQAANMGATARRHGRFLMEAIWSRFLPAYQVLNDLLADGAIGEVLHVDASFGFRAPIDPVHRLFDINLAGGALLDLGLYPVQLAHLILGTPTAVVAHGRIGETKVDEHVVVSMGFDTGAMAVAQAATRTPLSSTARIAGSNGTIALPQYMHAPTFLDVETSTGSRRIDTPLGAAPLRFEVEEVERCLAAGQTESAAMPLAESCAIATTLDLARTAIGLRYPAE